MTPGEAARPSDGAVSGADPRSVQVRAAVAAAVARVSVRLSILWPDAVGRLRRTFPEEWERIADAEQGIDGASRAHLVGAAPWATVAFAVGAYEGAWARAAERLRRWERRKDVHVCDRCGVDRPLIIIHFDDGEAVCGRCWRA